MIWSKNSGELQLTKFATMHTVWTDYLELFFIFSRAYYILDLFLAIIQILKPAKASSSQNPSPIPSLPPVTMTHEFLPYFFIKLLAENKLMKNIRALIRVIERLNAPNRPHITTQGLSVYKIHIIKFINIRGCLLSYRTISPYFILNQWLVEQTY